MTVEYVEKVYNRVSIFYDLVFGPIFRSGLERMPELLDLFPGADLLDVGVGTGLSIPTIPKNVNMTGIDLSERMLAKAKKRLSRLDVGHVNLMRMDATNLEFPDNSFDRVMASYLVSTVPNPVRVVEEMKRVCRPGGVILVLNHFKHEAPLIGTAEKVLSPLFYRIGFRTDLDLQELFNACALRIESIERIDGLGHWKAVRCINSG